MWFWGKIWKVNLNLLENSRYIKAYFRWVQECLWWDEVSHPHRVHVTLSSDRTNEDWQTRVVMATDLLNLTNKMLRTLYNCFKKQERAIINVLWHFWQVRRTNPPEYKCHFEKQTTVLFFKECHSLYVHWHWFLREPIHKKTTKINFISHYFNVL